MKLQRHFTKPNTSPYDSMGWTYSTSEIRNHGTIVFQG